MIKSDGTKKNKKLGNKLFWVIQLILNAILISSIFIIINQRNEIAELVAFRPNADKCANLTTNIISKSNTRRVKRSDKTQKSEKALETIEYSVETPISSEYLQIDATSAKFDENSRSNNPVLFVPLFAQLSTLEIEKLCHQKYGKTFKNSALHTMSNQVNKININESKKQKNYVNNREKSKNENRTKHRNTNNFHRQHSIRKFREKVCVPIKSFSSPLLVGERKHKSGAVMRYGNNWLLTEYQTGNTVFQFDSEHKSESNDINYNKDDNEKNYLNVEEQTDNVPLKSNDFLEFEQLKNTKKRSPSTLLLKYPTAIHALSEPFYGTDHTVSGSGKQLIFYYVLSSDARNGSSRIQSLHLSSGRRITKLIDANTGLLYGGRESTINSALYYKIPAVDLEVDQTALWAIYRKPNQTTFSVLKLSQNSLKELSHWELKELETRHYLNAFVNCGILYTITTENQIYNKVSNNQKNNDDELNDSVLSYNTWRMHRSKNKNDLKNSIVIDAVFDFHIGDYIKPPSRILTTSNTDDFKWLNSGLISNVQYDSVSDSLNVFDNGKIFSILLKRKRFN